MRSRLLVAALAVCLCACSNGDGHGTVSGVPTASDGVGASPQATLRVGGSDGSLGDGTPTPLPVSGSSAFVVAGRLESGRLAALRADALPAAARDGGPAPLRAMSAVVGGALEMLPYGRNVLVVSSNQAEVVAVTDDFRKVTPIPIANRIGSGGSPLHYGDIVRQGDSAIVAVAFADQVALVRIALRTLAISQVKVYDDRYAGGPQACLTTNGTLAVQSAGGYLDFLDPNTLERRATVHANGLQHAMTCVGNAVWSAEYVEGLGHIYDTTGRETGRFEWAGGDGAEQMTYDPVSRRVFGTDAGKDSVFSCPTAGGPCRVLGGVGAKPTSVLAFGKYVVVTVENSRGLAVLDATALRLIGRVALGDLTRGLAFLPGPPL